MEGSESPGDCRRPIEPDLNLHLNPDTDPSRGSSGSLGESIDAATPRCGRLQSRGSAAEACTFAIYALIPFGKPCREVGITVLDSSAACSRFAIERDDGPTARADSLCPEAPGHGRVRGLLVRC
jgi:hypothetical protein